MTDEDMKAIDNILGNKPSDYEGYGGSARFRRLDTI
jgi:hypothetical protein